MPSGEIATLIAFLYVDDSGHEISCEFGASLPEVWNVISWNYESVPWRCRVERKEGHPGGGFCDDLDWVLGASGDGTELAVRFEAHVVNYLPTAVAASSIQVPRLA